MLCNLPGVIDNGFHNSFPYNLICIQMHHNGLLIFMAFLRLLLENHALEGHLFPDIGGPDRKCLSEHILVIISSRKVINDIQCFVFDKVVALAALSNREDGHEILGLCKSREGHSVQYISSFFSQIMAHRLFRTYKNGNLTSNK
jgi:hypothetical protein